jgi:uncharacterized membrane protein YhaH (DUF805 family)
MMSTIQYWFKLWFGFQAPIDRRVYLLSGLGLMVARCVGDLLILLSNGATLSWTLLNPSLYLAPSMASRGAIIHQLIPDQIDAADPGWPLITMAMWALPFLWIGVSMSLRRARDAGMSAWLGLSFFIPVFNLLAIAAFCALPSRPKKQDASPSSAEGMGILRSAMEAVALAAGFGVLVMLISVFLLGEYGLMLFVGGPVVMGTIAGWRVNQHHYRGFTPALIVSVVACALCSGMLLVFALEGIVCLMMVSPLAVALTVFGAIFGTLLAKGSGPSGNSVTAMAFVLPIIGGTDLAMDVPLPVYEMTSEITVNAPPEAVWPNVVGFSDLPPPQDWLMNTGIACPLRATIKGEGVGAVRYCEFTTGPFVEPITVWDPPNRLAFNVIEQPEPMHEWSPYEEVYAPHLHDTMLSQRGQFELIEKDGQTLLRGTTWYTLDLAPGSYWRLWSDFVVHRIHMRVLKHVKDLSETPA